jgi:hypothetical protein
LCRRVLIHISLAISTRRPLGAPVSEKTTLAIWRNQARLYGKLTLSDRNWEKLFSLAARGVDAQGKVLVDPEGMSDCVITALETPQPRRRRVREVEPV